MPQMTGLELAGALWQQRPGLPVNGCTGLADRVDARQADALGIAQRCLKPVPLSELRAALRRVMGAAASAVPDR